MMPVQLLDPWYQGDAITLLSLREATELRNDGVRGGKVQIQTLGRSPL